MNADVMSITASAAQIAMAENSLVIAVQQLQASYGDFEQLMHNPTPEVRRGAESLLQTCRQSLEVLRCVHDTLTSYADQCRTLTAQAEYVHRVCADHHLTWDGDRYVTPVVVLSPEEQLADPGMPLARAALAEFEEQLQVAEAQLLRHAAETTTLASHVGL